MWLFVERLTILPLVVMGTKALVVSGVDFPNLLAVGTVFSYRLHAAAILIEDCIGGVWAMAFFGQLDGSLLLEFDDLCPVFQDMNCLPATAILCGRKEVVVADEEMDNTAIVFMSIGLVERHQPDGSYGL